MLKKILQRWADWTGDKDLSDAIRAELRRQGYAVHAARTRDVRLAAIERPGWVQVYAFTVETTTAEADATSRRPVRLHGVSRDDGRRNKTEVLLTEDAARCRQQLEAWSEGLIVRR